LVPKPWKNDEWLLWQFTSMGNGITYGAESSEIDLNYFNGDANEFAQRFKVPIPDDTTPPDPSSRNKYVVNAGALYVREGPGTNYKSLGYLQRNDVVEALASNFDGSWLQVRRDSDGLMGWCSVTYLVRINPNPTPDPTPDPIPPDGTPGSKRYRVTARALYVREGPDTSFRSVGYLVRDDTVEELESNSNGSWKRIRRLTDKLTGWCSTTYLLPLDTSPVPPDDNPPPDPTPDPTGEKYKVIASKLNVREGPATSFKSLGYLQQNDIVDALDTNADKSWIQIRRSDGLTGWASASFLIKVVASPIPPNGDPGTKYKITISSLYMREGPDATYKTLGYVKLNDIVDVIESNANQSWRKIRRSDGLVGWSSALYMTPVN